MTVLAGHCSCINFYQLRIKDSPYQYINEYSRTFLNVRRNKITFIYNGSMKSLDKIHLDKNLSRLIKENGTSLHQLSARLRINKSSLHNYLNGIRPQGLIALIKICDYFEVSLDQLVFDLLPQTEHHKVTNPKEFYEVTIQKIITKTAKNR